MKRCIVIGCIAISALYLSCASSQQQQPAAKQAQKVKDGPGQVVIGGGTVLAKGNFKKGLKDGPWVHTYMDTKTKQGEGNYKEDKQDGRWVFYHKNGQKMAEGEFSEGNRNGPWVQYYETGQKQADLNYTIITQSIEGIGETIREKVGVLSGTKTTYHKDGKPQREEKYVDGKKNGIVSEYYEDGRPKERSIFRNDLNDGSSNLFWPNGKHKEKGSYSNGKRVGFWEYYHNNGLVSMKGNYNNNLMVGRWQHFSAEGLLQKEGDFKLIDATVKGKVEKRSIEDGLWKFYRYPGGRRELAMEVALANSMIDSNSASKLYQNGKMAGTGPLQIGLVKGIYDIMKDNKKIGTMPSSSAPPDEPEKNTTYRWTGEWDAPKKQGQWKEYFPNGRLMAEGEYMVNRKNGQWKVYNQDGSVNDAESGNYMFGTKRGR